jgi:hypothetical protein
VAFFGYRAFWAEVSEWSLEPNMAKELEGQRDQGGRKALPVIAQDRKRIALPCVRINEISDLPDTSRIPVLWKAPGGLLALRVPFLSWYPSQGRHVLGHDL